MIEMIIGHSVTTVKLEWLTFDLTMIFVSSVEADTKLLVLIQEVRSS